ncbi:MAG: IclR family transcriptional regulator [Steroidobacteraceae bacterium]|nr:IclR family transcriptional regulator [Steroidobacteraceae bacterium]
MTILEAFEEKRRPLTLRELAEHCGIPVSTSHALVHTLLSRGYLYQTSRRKDLYPTRRILDMAATIVAFDPYLERIAPTLEQLRLETSETVLLGKRRDDRILYLEVLESPQTIRYSSRAGELKPLHSSAIGKVMLGAMDTAALRTWLAAHPLPQITGNTIITCEQLLENLEAGHRCGYFVTSGENVPDVTAVAIPIVINSELLGLAVAGPSHRMQPAMQEHVSRLLRAQRRLQELGVAA